MPAKDKRPALFLDRDGVLIADKGYVFRPDQAEWIPGAQAAVRLANELGFLVLVISNQSGIARGLYTESDACVLHNWMRDRLREAGAHVDAFYICPHHPDFGAPADRDCCCRKPRPGLFERAVADWNVDTALSLTIGDQDRDLQAGTAAGIRGQLFTGGDLFDFVQAELQGHIRVGLFASEASGLLETQRSLLDQDFRNWRLLLTADLPLLPELVQDERVVRLESSSAWLDAASAAGCEWLGVLPGGLTLLPGALREFSRRAHQSPVELLFSDEDEGGRPFYKPGWQPDLRLTHDQLGAFPLVRLSLARQIAGHLPLPCDPASRLAFNIELSFTAAQVEHIAETLVLRNPVLLPYASKEAQSEAANGHLRRHGLPGAVVKHPLTGCLRVLALVSAPRLVSVILFGEECERILDTANAIRAAHPNSTIEIIRNTIGEGARKASGDVLVFLRAALDTPTGPWLSLLVEHAMRPDVCAVGARICSIEGTVVHAGHTPAAHDKALPQSGAGLDVSNPGPHGLALSVRNVSGASVDCLCIATARFKELGGFSEAIEPSGAALDLCLRGSQRGWLNVITPFCDMLAPGTVEFPIEPAIAVR